MDANRIFRTVKSERDYYRAMLPIIGRDKARAVIIEARDFRWRSLSRRIAAAQS